MPALKAVFVKSLVLTLLAALLQLGASGMAAHADDGCDDETCHSLQCDMAAGNGCASLCGQVVAAPVAVKAVAACAVCNAVAIETPHHNLRLKNRPFRPPIVA